MKNNKMSFATIVGKEKAKERKGYKKLKAQAAAKADKKAKKYNLSYEEEDFQALMYVVRVFYLNVERVEDAKAKGLAYLKALSALKKYAEQPSRVRNVVSLR